MQELLNWSEQNYQHLPWRQKRTLYRTLVSEIMLQQTTVSTVLNHFDRFLVQFPSLQSLAMASDQDVLTAWKGLGYYRRARNLKKAAEYIEAELKGEFPQTIDELVKIPGVGEYTANALLAIGTDRKNLAIDANLERVISRLYGLHQPKGPLLQKAIQSLFREGKIFAHYQGSYRHLNESLMDLGRVYCQARKTSCLACPMNGECQAFQSGRQFELPVVLEKKQVKHQLELLRVVKLKGDKILCYQKNESEWLSGQWELPTFILSTTDKTLGQYPLWEKSVDCGRLPWLKTGITKYKITNFVTLDDLSITGPSYVYRPLEEIYPELSTTSHKILKLVFDL